MAQTARAMFAEDSTLRAHPASPLPDADWIWAHRHRSWYAMALELDIDKDRMIAHGLDLGFHRPAKGAMDQAPCGKCGRLFDPRHLPADAARVCPTCPPPPPAPTGPEPQWKKDYREAYEARYGPLPLPEERATAKVEQEMAASLENAVETGRVLGSVIPFFGRRP